MTETASALWLNSVFAGFDSSVTIAVHRLYDIGGGFFTPFFEFISILGKGGAFLIFLSLLLTLYKPTRRFGTAMCLGLLLGALVTNCCLKVLIARARPYVDQSSVYYRFWQLVGMHTESDKSFPSGHTTAAFGACRRADGDRAHLSVRPLPHRRDRGFPCRDACRLHGGDHRLETPGKVV